MKTKFAGDLTIKDVGKEVTLYGWVKKRRDHGKLIFVDLEDAKGIIQVVVNPKKSQEAYKTAGILKPEFVIYAKGRVLKRDSGLVNKKLKTGEIEVEAEEIKVLAKAKILPFDISSRLEINTYLDNLPLTLRSEKHKAIFRIQAEIVEAFRAFLRFRDFTEIQTPNIVASATEGGANVFEIKYFEHKAYLAQSPQFYKQIMVGVFERVFTVGNAYRAEEHSTTRHLNEYTSLDLEFGFIKDHTDIMKLENELLIYMMNYLRKTCKDDLEFLEVVPPEVPKEIPSMKLTEVQEILDKEFEQKCKGEPDLDPSQERMICEYAKKKFNSDFIFITHYPTKKRPMYTYPDESDPKYTKSFDLLFRGVEITTGGQRINDYDQLVSNIKKWGFDPNDFSFYLEAFKYGMPSEGGLGMGLERLTAQLLNIQNIKEATLFPRDLNRIDLSLSRKSFLKEVSEDKGMFDKIVEFLKKNDVKYKVFKHKPVYTSEEAAEVRNTKPGEGAKAMVVKYDDKFAMAVLSGDKKLDLKKLAEILGTKKVELADKDEVEKITDCKVGSVSPFGNLSKLAVYADKSLSRFEDIVFNAGSHTKSIKMKYADYVRIVQPEICEFSK